MTARPAFTLIETLIVVVILAVLAATALPRYTDTTRRAYLSTVRATLNTATTKQQLHYARHGGYARDPDGTGTTDPVTITDSTTVDGLGWVATATHASLDDDVGCAVYLGTATAPSTHGSPQQPAVVSCTDP